MQWVPGGFLRTLVRFRGVIVGDTLKMYINKVLGGCVRAEYYKRTPGGYKRIYEECKMTPGGGKRIPEECKVTPGGCKMTT